ncbi:MAG: hypothetical protein ACR2QO_08535 [Acidimicrobiales bacterium]
MSDRRDGDLLLTSYRYLRIGMLGVVLALAVSIGIERSAADCWQPAVSSYFHTPVRAIFVGGLMAIAVSLIVIKGDGRWEDIFFNFAGIMAPIVAVIPTDAFGADCAPSAGGASVRTDGEWTPLLQASIDNNVTALLITGFAGLIVAAVLAMFVNGSVRAPAIVGAIEQRLGLLVTFGLLVALSAAYRWWDNFSDRAHGWSAVAMFVLLGAGIGANAYQRWRRTTRQRYCRIYTLIVVGMAASAIVIGLLLPDPWEHRILVLEAVEIAWFAGFWIVQTYELWNEPRLPDADIARTPTPAPLPAGV